MDAAALAGFQAGAGVDPAALRLAAGAFVAVAAISWAAWIAFGLHQSWRDGGVDGFDVQVGIVRATVLAMLVLIFVR